MVYAALVATILLHFLWCVWVVLGWRVTREGHVLRRLHIASLCYAIAIELAPWPLCPLTLAEEWLEPRAGIEPAHAPFLVRILDAVVYPDLPNWLVAGGAVVACLGILGVYVRRGTRGEKTKRDAGPALGGLCANCAHARRIESARGSLFVLCHLSASDSTFAKYPRLPVVECRGYLKRAPDS
jgi:hypothetical protein